MKCDLNSFENFFKKVGYLGTKTLRLLPPEFAHDFAGLLLKHQIIPVKVPSEKVTQNFDLKVKVEGLPELKHPIALAAGFDKNAEYLAGISKLDFSLVEVGAATPLAQAGHEKPRLFRQPAQRSLINRMAFNNKGVNVINQNLIDFNKSQKEQKKVLGVNIGPNKKTALADALGDYLKLLNSITADVSYFSVNLSSPNTASLKSLCGPEFIKDLAAQIQTETKRSTKNIWIKLGPNLSKDFFQEIISAIKESDFAGVILTNTYPTSSPEKGGLSGHPLMLHSTKCLEWAWEVHQGTLPMVGVGGLLSGSDVFEKIIRGASFVQIYTALIYRGPFVVYELLQELVDTLRERGFKSLDEARGTYYHL